MQNFEIWASDETGKYAMHHPLAWGIITQDGSYIAAVVCVLFVCITAIIITRIVNRTYRHEADAAKEHRAELMEIARRMDGIEDKTA